MPSNIVRLAVKRRSPPTSTREVDPIEERWQGRTRHRNQRVEIAGVVLWKERSVTVEQAISEAIASRRRDVWRMQESMDQAKEDIAFWTTTGIPETTAAIAETEAAIARLEAKLAGRVEVVAFQWGLDP
jgi:hypothetical protein